jgi:hypothetical protein
MTPLSSISGDSASPSGTARHCPPCSSLNVGNRRSTGKSFQGSDEVVTVLHDLETEDQVESPVPVLSCSDCRNNPWSTEQERENEFKWNRNQRRPIPKMTKIR